MFQLISVEWEGIERWPTFARGGNIIGEFRWFPWSWFTTCRGSEYTISISKWLSTSPVIFLNVSHDLKASHEGWQIYYKNIFYNIYYNTKYFNILWYKINILLLLLRRTWTNNFSKTIIFYSQSGLLWNTCISLRKIPTGSYTSHL